MNNPKRGEIYRYERTYTDKVTGKKEYESIPCIIISPNRRHDTSTSILVATISTTVGALRYPGEQFNITDGPLKNHVVSCGSIFTMDRNRLQIRVGALNDVDMDKLDECLLNSVGIEAVLVDEETEPGEKKVSDVVNSEPTTRPSSQEYIELLTKMNFYKEQYEMLLDRLINR